MSIGHADVADAIGQRRVVLVRQAQELDAVVAQRPDRAHDVLGAQRDVLACRAIEYQSRNSWIWLFFLPVAGSLIGNLIRPLPLVMTFDIRARVLGVDDLVVVVDELGEAEHVAVEVDERVHVAELDVADAVVDLEQRQAARPRGPAS